MKFDVSVRNAAVLATLRKGAKRTAYAVAGALNKTIKTVQGAQVYEADRNFSMRRDGFVRRQVSVIQRKDFASAKLGVMQARTHVGNRDRLLLAGFNVDDVRRPFTPGAKRVAVPVGPARPRRGAPVPEQFTFRRLRLVKKTRSSRLLRGSSKRRKADVVFRRRKTSTGAVQFLGANRTFILMKTAKAPEGGVFQRIGPKRDDIRMIYSFVRPFRLGHKLHHVEIGETVARRWFAANLKAEVEKTLAYQAGR